MQTEISLRSAKDEDAICKIGRDHYEIGDWTIMTNGYDVWISKQKVGQQPTDHIEVPKAIFDRLLKAYERPQKVRAA